MASVRKKKKKTRTTGRPRSERSRQAILTAALELLETEGYRGISIEAIAARAGVGKQTIYRWWSCKADVVLEAYAEAAAERSPDPDTGAIRSDLMHFVRTTFAGACEASSILCSLMAEAQLNGDFADRFRNAFINSRRAILYRILDRGIARGELASDIDRQLLADLIYGPMWYRLLNRHAPVDAELAAELVSIVMVRAGPWDGRVLNDPG